MSGHRLGVMLNPCFNSVWICYLHWALSDHMFLLNGTKFLCCETFAYAMGHGSMTEFGFILPEFLKFQTMTGLLFHLIFWEQKFSN